MQLQVQIQASVQVLVRYLIAHIHGVFTCDTHAAICCYLLLFADSSLGNAPGGSSQIAHMICAADVDILRGKEADVSPLTYTSHHMSRAGSATLLVEASAMSEGLADAEWAASWIGLVKDLHYDLRKR